MDYPNTERIDVKEIVHNKEIIDSYRWLEDFEDAKVQKWLKEQHEYTDNMLNQIPNRTSAIERIQEFLSLGELTAPKKKRNKIFFQERKTENQPILYVQIENKEKKVLLDPNNLSKENPIAIDWYHISPEGNYIAYGLSKDGNEWSILHIMEINSGKILSERIPRTRFCSLAWLSDESGFYYTRYPQLGEVPPGQENYNKHIYFHKIGTDWKNDPKIFGEGRAPTNHYGIKLSNDDRFLLIDTMKYTKSDLQIMDLHENRKLLDVIVDQDVLTSGAFMDGVLWLLTNRNHPNKAIYKVDITNPSFENWELVVSEKDDEIISNVIVTPKRIFCKVMINASDFVKVYSINGEYQTTLKLPDFSTIFDFTSRGLVTSNEKEFYFGLRSFFYPANIYKHDINSNNTSLFKQITSPVNPDDYIVEQVWYESKDKTKVSMFLAYKKDIKKDGKNPTLLCGYGGFNLPLQPPYLKYSRFYWLERGGIVAIANLRGGSEYGEKWHRAGMLEKKQNVFDDFIYAGKWLIENKYTSNKNLGIFGRSNGGLLTGAVVTQEPELFGAVYIGVPLLDMIRYHLFRIARYWIPEYGSSEDSEQFDFILKYSPYHNVKQGTKYPATFLVTAASDSRVDPNHAMKMTALMQNMNTSKEPIMLFVEKQAGHGVGKPLEKLAITEADLYTFIGWKTGLKM